MRRIRRVGMVWLALLGAGSGALGSPQAHAASAPDATLRLSDLPLGFHRVMARTWSNRQAAEASKLSLPQLNSHGRLTDHETAYRSTSRTGMLSLDNTVVQYKTAAGAHWELGQDFHAVLHTRSGLSYHRIPDGHIGNEGAAYTTTFASHGYSFSFDIVYFRRNEYVVLLRAEALAGRLSAAKVTHLAQLVDRRIVKG